MEIVFRTNGNEKQKQVCKYWVDSETTEIVYGGSKGSGKSYLGCSLIFADALIYPETLYFIARKSLNDLRKYTLPSIYEVLENYGVGREYYKFNGQDNYFQLHNGSKVFLIEAKYMPSDPLYQRFGSMQMTRGWIEEGGEFELAAKSNLSASIGRWKNFDFPQPIPAKLLITCNPSKNFLYKDFYKKSKEGTLENWRKFVQAYPQDNKKLPAGYVDHLLKTLTVNERERLLFGNWEYDDDPAVLIDYDNILDLFKNEHVKNGVGYISADIARKGKDNTTVMVWSGKRVEKIVTLKKALTTETSKQIKALANSYKIPMSRVIVDEDGVGGGVVDQLSCKGFVNNSKAIEGNYSNLKSECGFKLAEKINNAEIFINCPDDNLKALIIEELEQLKDSNVDSEGKLSLLNKEAVKERIGRSPDYSDALLMRMYFELNITAKITRWSIN
jgi:hypothetical protein